MKNASRPLKAILIFFAIFFISGCATKTPALCGNRIIIASKHKFKFNRNEQSLLCGETDVPAWKEVPLSQTEFHLRTFLKTRGYYAPEFSLLNHQLVVDPGALLQIRSVNFIDDPEGFSKIRYAGWVGRPLVSQTLDEIEAWSINRLKNLGYACATVQLRAETENGIVRVVIRAGKKFTIPELSYDDPSPLPPRVRERFYAFKPGDLYVQNLFDLSSARVENQGVVTHSSFVNRCEKDSLQVKHTVTLGEPRLLRIGVGLSTEEIGIGRLQWKNTRLGKNASILGATLYGSRLRQEGQVSFEWHVFERLSRWYLLPQVNVDHINERDQQYFSFSILGALGTSQDIGKVTLDAHAGPNLAYERVTEGAAVGLKQFLSWNTSWTLRSEDFQIYARDPRSGFMLNLETASLVLTQTSKTNTHRVALSGTQLWNIGGYSPPKYILGYRFSLVNTFVQKDYDVVTGLPPEFFTWLGGANNIRGFGRRELTVDNGLALSSAYVGFELRAPALLPEKFDPFVLLDAGKLGRGNFQLDSPFYWSPGLGLRWGSPIGALRTSVAHGFITGDPSETRARTHYQFFVSLGQEF